MPASLNRPILLGFGTQMAATAMQLVVVLVVARLLGPQGQGQLATALLPPQLLVVALNLGLGPALIFFLNRGEIRLSEAVALCRRLLALLVPAGLLLALLLQLTARERLYPGIPSTLLLAALPLLPAMLGRLWWCQLLQARRDFLWYNRLQLLQPVLLLALVTLAATARSGPRTIVLLMAASHAVTWIAASLVLRAPLAAEHPGPAGLPAGFLRRCLAYGLPSLGANLVEFVNLRGSLLLVNGVLGPLEAGLFKLDTQLGEPLLLPASAAVTVLLPRLSDPDLTGRRRLAFTGSWLLRVLAAALALALAIGLGAPLLVPLLFGEAYARALPALPLLLPAYLGWSAVNLIWAHMAASGQPRRPLAIGLVTLALNVASNLVLMPRLGLPGAALASSLTFAAAALLSWAAIDRDAQSGDRPAPP